MKCEVWTAWPHHRLLLRFVTSRLEEDERLVLTPFEKNLEVWRQLWRVLERSDVIVQVLCFQCCAF